MELTGAGRTDRGRVRPHNEDALLIDVSRGLFAVADGMGGHAAGEVASRLAIETIDSLLQQPAGGETDPTARLREAIDEANRRIASQIEQQPEYQGMGTTLVVAVANRDRFWIAHVGDSRAYLVRGEEIRQLTADHSFVNELVRLGMLSREQAARDPRRNVVTRALGSGAVVVPEIQEQRVQAGDLLLLCSDGLTTMLGDERILSIVRAAPDLETGCEQLVAAANDAGGEDNVTIILARLTPE
ncbi:MAG: Stp1/IreP family PP2C-type Ser/Thr phosphatase [Acidobacteria bacterium]|nr:Stp1/IreP family PP2C-type Ser/Thr phosphatase [Acidobacteriota bacterium]